MKPTKTSRQHHLSAITIAASLWCVLTTLILASTVGLYTWKGATGLGVIIQKGPLSNLSVTLYSVAVVWFMAGILLFLLHFQRINSANAVTLAGFLIICLLYSNILRERPEYGDIQYYVRAATSLYRGEPLPAEYVYPPLWAALLEPLVPLGGKTIFSSVWLLNLISLFAFYFILVRILQHYGFSPRLSALVTTVFMAINAPLLRTLVYMQVNLHVMNLVLLSLLLYRRAPFFSALALSIAVHLKISPIVLVLAFLLEKNWRWLGCFALNMLLVGALPLVLDGPSPYLDFLRNASSLAGVHGLSFRENSFDSFFTAAGKLIHLAPFWIYAGAYMGKAILIVATFFVAAHAIRQKTFYNGEPGTYLYNAVAPLTILMTLASPIVWEHHGVFLALAFLLLLKRLETSGEWLLFGFAYFLEYLLPTFDYFPWSYGRLLAPLICLGLMWRISKRQGVSGLFESMNNWLIGLSPSRVSR